MKTAPNCTTSVSEVSLCSAVSSSSLSCSVNLLLNVSKSNGAVAEDISDTVLGDLFKGHGSLWSLCVPISYRVSRHPCGDGSEPVLSSTLLLCTWHPADLLTRNGCSAVQTSDHCLCSRWSLPVCHTAMDSWRGCPLGMIVILSINSDYSNPFPHLQATSFSSALTHSADLCFYTYIYSKVDRKRFQQVTSYLKSAALFGRCTGALLGQLLIMFNVMNPKELIYISLAGDYDLRIIWIRI